MEPSHFDKKLERLQHNVEALLMAYQKKVAENSQLAADNRRLIEQVEALETKISDFQNQDKMSKLVNSKSVEREDSIELKNRLNEYIKEIDRCIAFLS